MSAGLIAAGSVVGGGLAGSGSKGSRESRKAREELRYNNDLAVGYLEPYAQYGEEDWNAYRDAAYTPYGEFEGGDRFTWDSDALLNDPGYQFTLAQALQGTERMQNAGGNQWSGNILAALQDRAGGLSSSYSDLFRRNALDESNTNYGRDVGEYNMGYTNYLNNINQLRDLSNVGREANTNISNLYSNLGSNLANVWSKASLANQNQSQFQAGSLNNMVQGGISNYMSGQGVSDNYPYNDMPDDYYGDWGY